MPLPIKKLSSPLGRTVNPRPTPGKPFPKPSPTKRVPASVTVRMPGNHMAMLQEIMQQAECDKSEAIKRAIRREHSILSARNAVLTITDADGKKSEVPLVRNGVPL